MVLCRTNCGKEEEAYKNKCTVYISWEETRPLNMENRVVNNYARGGGKDQIF